MERSDVTFTSGDATCAGWHYQPVGATGTRPIIVMAHGLGAIKEMGLDAFAERFTAAGYDCLVFDYRHFGASGGQPRQLLDVDRQLEDWAAAIAYARTLPGVDPDRVVLWGTSFSGGHVIIAGSRDPRVAAVLSQCPFTDGLASVAAIPVLTSLKLTGKAFADVGAALLRRPPVTVPTAGRPGETAMMTAPDVHDGYLGLVPEGVGFENRLAARLVLRIVRHAPGRYAKRLTQPAFFAVCERDSVAPAKRSTRHLARAPR